MQYKPRRRGGEDRKRHARSENVGSATKEVQETCPHRSSAQRSALICSRAHGTLTPSSPLAPPDPGFGADSGVLGNPMPCRGGTNPIGRVVMTVGEMNTRCADVHERGVKSKLPFGCHAVCM